MNTAHSFTLSLIAMTLTLLAGTPEIARAQVGSESRIKGGSRQPSYDDQGRLTRLITYESARIQGKRVIVKDFQLKTYRHKPDRKVDLIMEAPKCHFGEFGASSDGKITMRSGNNGFALTGRGFLWDRPQSRLVISNQVTTKLHALPSAKESDAPDSAIDDLQIESQHFEYHFGDNRALYSGNVTATAPNRITVTCRSLETKLDPRSHAFQEVIANEAVRIDLHQKGRQIHVTGTNAVYQAAGEKGAAASVRITGSPKWRTEQANGGGEVLTVAPAAQHFEAKRNAFLNLPKAEGLLLSQTETKSGSATSKAINIKAGRYRFQNGRIRFEGGVEASQASTVDLKCSAMTVQLDEARRHVRNMTAEGEVAITAKGSNEATIQANGEKLAFKRDRNGEPRITIRGKPSWQTSRYKGSAKRLILYPAKRVFTAREQAFVKILPLSDGSSPTNDSEAGRATSVPVKIGNTPIRVRSRDYEIGSKEAVFTGEVRVKHQDWQLGCGLMNLFFNQERHGIRKIQAAKGVNLTHAGASASSSASTPNDPDRNSLIPKFFNPKAMGTKSWQLQCDRLNLTSPSGNTKLTSILASGTVHLNQGANQAQGDRLTYNGNNGRFKLKGKPKLTGSSGTTLQGQKGTVFILENKTRRFRTKGSYRMVLPQESQSSSKKGEQSGES